MDALARNQVGITTAEGKNMIREFFAARPNAVNGTWNFWKKDDGSLHAEFACGLDADFLAIKDNGFLRIFTTVEFAHYCASENFYTIDEIYKFARELRANELPPLLAEEILKEANAWVEENYKTISLSRLTAYRFALYTLNASIKGFF